MPTTYKATTDHRPLAWGAAFEKIDEFLDGQLAALAKLAGGDRADLEEDALTPLRESITMFLIQFLAKCSARPLRTPNKLIGTLKRIAKKPQEFVDSAGSFDPEVVDLIYAAYSKQSPAHKAALLRFEIGQGSLDPVAVSAAATTAMSFLTRSKKNNVRRPIDYIRTAFASLALELFETGGRTATSTQNGTFWQFVKVLQEVVRPAAKAAGSALPVETVVREAIKLKDEDGRKVAAKKHPIVSVE